MHHNQNQTKQSQTYKTTFHSETVYEGTSFGVKEYERAFNTGSLKSMTFYCPNKEETERLRSRVIGYSKSRRHILETTRHDDKHITVKYTGRLPDPY